MFTSYHYTSNSVSNEIPNFETNHLSVISTVNKSQERRKESFIKNNNQTGRVDEMNEEAINSRNKRDQMSIKVFGSGSKSKKSHMRQSSINSYWSNSTGSYLKSSNHKSP